MATTSSVSAPNTSGIVSSSAAISSLGLGSGVLTSNVITQLEAADKTMMINPIDNKIAIDEKKQTSLKQLTTLLSSFQTAAYSLQDATAYQSRTVTGTNSGVNVTASAGVAIQNFTISNTTLATTNVMQSGSFASPSDTVASGTGTLNVNIDNSNYKIDYTASTTYSQLVDSINNAASSKITASILQTGTNAYSLIVNSKQTGKSQEISLTDLSGNLNSTLKNDALLSGGFSTSSSAVATGSGTMTINAAGTNFNIAYSSTTTVSSLADTINQDASLSADVSASVIQNSSGGYQLVLTAKKPAENQTISITDQTTGGSLSTNLTTSSISQSGSVADVQSATDASFLYNGIALTRATNTITDITPGLTISLLSNNANASINITQDNSSVKTALGNLVTGYNALQKQIKSMTLSDTAAKTVGLFSGSFSINSIQENIASLISSVNSNNQSLIDYGVTFNRNGTLSFDPTKFTSMVQNSQSDMVNFFSGATTVNANGSTSTTTGIFTQLYNQLQGLQSSTGTVTVLNQEISTQIKQYQTQKTNALSLLSSKYAIMTHNFTKYDALINSFNTQFASLQQQIDAAMNGKVS